MAGHNKWSQIKRKKRALDQKRGKIISKHIRAIQSAVRSGGGGDGSANLPLKNALAAAKSDNVPIDNIDRAIERAMGGAEGGAFEEVLYEGYGPSGVAMLVEALTDNKNRTAADVRHIFDRAGGKLGTDGSVSWIFERKGVIFVEAGGLTEDELMMAAIDAGAEDVGPEGDSFQILTDPSQFMAVRQALEEAGIKYTSAELTMIPKSTVVLDESDARKTFRLLDALEDHDDIQEVFANFDIPDEIMQVLAG